MPAIRGTVAEETRSTVLKLDGDLELFTRRDVRARLARLTESRYAIIDLSDARIADATFLGELQRLATAPAASTRIIVLVTPSPMTRKILRLVRFDHMFPIVTTLAQAHELIEVFTTDMPTETA